MPVRDNREYRNIPLFTVEKREEGADPSYTVEGYASTFETYPLWEFDGVTYYERIDPKAFDECDMSDVIFCKDHGGTVFARTRNNTLQLSIDEHGLKTRTDLSKTASARSMFEEIEAGMYDQMSFAFVVTEDAFDRETHTRTVLKIGKLYDVSAVSFPANPGTDISPATRSAFDGFIEQEKLDLAEKRKQIELAKAKYFYEEVN